jgi:hypothetical protein
LARALRSSAGAEQPVISAALRGDARWRRHRHDGHHLDRSMTFGDADNILDFNARYELQVSSRAVGFVGYRPLDCGRDNAGDDEIVGDVQPGLRFAF